jgi:hypothetical protein
MNIVEDNFLEFFNENNNEEASSLELVINSISKIDSSYKYSFGRWAINRFPIFKDSIVDVLDKLAEVDSKSEVEDLRKNAFIWSQCRKFSEEKSLRMQLVLLYDDVLFIRDPLVWYFHRREDEVSLTSCDQSTGFKLKYLDVSIDKLFEKIPLGLGIALDSKIITSEKAIKISRKFSLA